MSATEITPQGADKKLLQLHNEEEARKARAAYSARASSDFYGAIGWLVGLFATLVISIPVIIFLYNNASTRSARATILTYGVAIAWWLNPLSLGALGYIVSNVRAWRVWTLLALFVWGGIDLLISLAIMSDSARIVIFNGLIVVGDRKSVV